MGQAIGMNDPTSIEQGLLLLYASLYLVTFRDATKRVVSWGAFEFRTFTVARSKIPRSFAILIVMPVAAFFLLSTLVAAVSRRALADTHGLAELPALAGFLFVVILFPWVSHHLWSVLVRRKVALGRDEGQPGYGWLNSNRSPDELPLPRYSYQLLAAFAVSLVAVLAVNWPLNFGRFPYHNTFWHQLFIVVYVSQLIVLFHIGRVRGFFVHDPKWLLSLRMIGTTLHTIIFPVVIGALIIPIAVSLDVGKITKWWLLVLGLALGFPYYCSQSTLLVAKWRRWRGEALLPVATGRPEIIEGDPRWWWVCLTAEVACVCTLLILWRVGLLA